MQSKYTITETILNNLTFIASAREVIEQADLIPKWEISLRRQAKLHNTKISLTDKQMKIIEFMNAHGKITNKDLQSLFRISAQAVHKELVKLVDLHLIKPLGAGRSVYYVLE
jgi:predicted HTH transcriptional regulator